MLTAIAELNPVRSPTGGEGRSPLCYPENSNPACGVPAGSSCSLSALFLAGLALPITFEKPLRRGTPLTNPPLFPIRVSSARQRLDPLREAQRHCRSTRSTRRTTGWIPSGNRVELEGVTLQHVQQRTRKKYDEVKSAKADFDVGNGLLVSEGMSRSRWGLERIPQKPRSRSGKLVVIKTSGVRYESKTGKAWTEKAATFKFDRGEGQSTGAEYDPNAHELHMHKDVAVEMVRFGKPMEIQAGALVYKEAESKVWLLDWSKFKRAALSMEAGPAIVTLENGAIRHVEAANARGADIQKERKVEYAANRLDMQFTEKGAVEDVIGDGNAKLVSTSATARTTVTSNRLDLDFDLCGR